MNDSPYAPQFQEIEYRKLLARALKQQGSQPQTTQMVSGRAIPNSRLGGLNQVFATALGTFGEAKAMKDSSALQAKILSEDKENVGKLFAPVQEQKAIPGTGGKMGGEVIGSELGDIVSPTMGPPTPPDVETTSRMPNRDELLDRAGSLYGAGGKAGRLAEVLMGKQLESMFDPKQEMPLVLGEGARAFGRDGRVIAENPKQKTIEPPKTRNRIDGGIEVQEEFDAATGKWNAIGQGPRWNPKPSQVVNVNTKQETEEGKAVGKGYGEQYIDIQKAGTSAGAKIAKLERMVQLLDGVETGRFTPAGTEIASTLQSFGIKVDPNIGNKQAAMALGNEIALELRNPSGGAGMPGAMSDQDRVYLNRMAPGLEKTPEGRAEIIRTMKALAKRDQDVARIAREYRKRNGTIDEGFYDELAKFSAENPLFGVSSSPDPLNIGVQPKKPQQQQKRRASDNSSDPLGIMSP